MSGFAGLVQVLSIHTRIFGISKQWHWILEALKTGCLKAALWCSIISVTEDSSTPECHPNGLGLFLRHCGPVALRHPRSLGGLKQVMRRTEVLLSKLFGTETGAKSPCLCQGKNQSQTSVISAVFFPTCSLVLAEIRFVSLLSASQALDPELEFSCPIYVGYFRFGESSLFTCAFVRTACSISCACSWSCISQLFSLQQLTPFLKECFLSQVKKKKCLND